jgi:deoxycytidylate deaminase
MDLKGEFAKLEKLHPGKSIAAYLDPPGSGIAAAVKPTLRYHVSNHSAVPAAAAMFDALEDRRLVYTNLAADTWLTTYMKAQLVHMGNVAGCTDLKAWQRKSVDWEIENVVVAPHMALRVGGRFLGDTPGPIAGGGLGAAAKEVAARPAAADAGSGRKKAIERALRYYALASYAVISRARHHSTMLGNYVGAILVSDSGRILGWGFNSTSYHHAEVNLTLAYLMANNGATALPANSVVFSSLTPCKQCAKLLETVRGGTNTIFYGQYDSGEFGKIGAATSAKIDSVTKPVVVGAKPARTQVAGTLDTEVAKSNIAKNIGESTNAKDLIDKTLAEIGRRVGKARDADDEEQAVKAAVLQHIKEVLDAIAV